MTRVGAASLALMLCALLAQTAYAQSQVPGTESAVTITMSPAYPKPGESVALTLSSTFYPLSTSNITWRSGATVISEGVGKISTTVTAGNFGEETDVVADVSGAEGEGSARISIIPTSVDLLWESDSYTPPFYRGRAMPSPGSHVRLLAMPHLPKAGGGYYEASELVYTWRIPSGTLSNLSGKGRSAITLNAPDLFGSYTVSVEVATPDKRETGNAAVSIVSVEPALVLYQNHPLYGTEYWSALQSTTFLSASRMTFAAIPYFASVKSMAARDLTYAWRVNGNSVRSDTVHPNEITLSAGAGGTLATLDLELTQASNFLIDSRGTWSITFTEGAGASSGTADLFHQTQ